MQEAYALQEGAFGRAVVLDLRDDLVSHAHAHAQFAFWLGGGRAVARLGNDEIHYSDEVALGANSYELHDARLFDKDQSALFLVFYIAKPWLDALRASSGRPFYFPSPRVPISPSLRNACWRVLDLMIEPQGDVRARMAAEVEGLISTAIDAALAPVDPRGFRRRAVMLDHRLRAAIAYMREHVGEPIAVDDVAGKVGVSRAHFYTLFRDQLNTTPQVFWSAVRVEEAVGLLARRSEPLTSVALELGFSSPGNFSRYFREHVGVSPSRYRRAAQGSERYPVTGLDVD